MSGSFAELSYETLLADLLQLLENRVVFAVDQLCDDPQLLQKLRWRCHIEAEVWATQLLGSAEESARAAVSKIIAILSTPDAEFDPSPQWWSSPFGRAVVLRVGHPSTTAVNYATCGAMLGITRQGVHDLVKRGKLDRHSEGGVACASIQHRARLVRSQLSLTATEHDVARA